MGLFSKVKENLQHGGVKIEINAPGRLEKGQTQLPVQVRVSADQNRAIKSVSARIERVYLDSGSDSSPSREPTVLTEQTSDQPFNLSAGQSVYLDFNLNLDPAAAMPDNPALGALANTVSKFANAYDKSRSSYRHHIVVRADVDGIKLDPQAKNDIIIDGLEESHFKISF